MTKHSFPLIRKTHDSSKTHHNDGTATMELLRWGVKFAKISSCHFRFIFLTKREPKCWVWRKTAVASLPIHAPDHHVSIVMVTRRRCSELCVDWISPIWGGFPNEQLPQPNIGEPTGHMHSGLCVFFVEIAACHCDLLPLLHL